VGEGHYVGEALNGPVQKDLELLYIGDETDLFFIVCSNRKQNIFLNVQAMRVASQLFMTVKSKKIRDEYTSLVH
jgi:hypothetical protein